MHESPLAIHHIGVAVPSIDDAMHFYGDTLGLSLVDSVDLPDRQLKVAFVQAANMMIELLEPTDPNSTVSRFLERRGPGLHHLCFGTPDIQRHLRDLEDKGVELIDTQARPGAHGQVAFLQPSAALGVLVELIQPSDGRLDGATKPATIAVPSPTQSAETPIARESTGPKPSAPADAAIAPESTEPKPSASADAAIAPEGTGPKPSAPADAAIAAESTEPKPSGSADATIAPESTGPKPTGSADATIAPEPPRPSTGPHD
jgi:methylmalonyl-CoA epimerase